MAKRKAFRVRVCRLPDGQPMTIEGRPAWALHQLHVAGKAGCTPLTTPGPRWSDYVFKLRGMGFDIETVTESHSGQFAGHHARYVLRSPINLAITGEDAKKEAA